jgi:hypothetical protein
MSTTGQPQPKRDPGAGVIQPVSAKTNGSLTESERKKRFAELRERLGQPRLKVTGDPAKHYFWAHRSDSQELDRLDLVGYTIVREPQAELVLAGKARARIQAGGLRNDGTYVLGDVILMECDQDLYDFLMMENDERVQMMNQAAKDNFLIEAEKAGAPTFEVEKAKVGGR